MARTDGFGRGEWEADIASAEPNLDHARATPAGPALVGREPLGAKFTVVVDRHTVPVRRAGGAVACSLDHGEILSQGHAQSFDELELELDDGEPAALFDLARDLSTRFDLQLSFTAKADRGFAVIEGRADEACKFVAPRLASDATAGEVFRAITRAALEQIVRNVEPIRRAPSAEAVHQMRVGARRLRATLKTFAEVVADDETAKVAADLKWLGAELDPARNLDVFISGVWARAAAEAGEDEPAIVQAQARLDAARAGAYARAQAAASSGQMRALLLDTLVWIESGPWTRRGAAGERLRDSAARGFASDSLSRARRKVLGKGRGLEDLSREDRHRVRIRAKALRYAADVLTPLFPGHPRRTKRFVGALKDLLEDLGDLNDIATGEALAAEYPPAGTLIAGQAKREARLLARACGHFGKLAAAKAFWKT
jgi:inorganic triphosphatase YgiF